MLRPLSLRLFQRQTTRTLTTTRVLLLDPKSNTNPPPGQAGTNGYNSSPEQTPPHEQAQSNASQQEHKSGDDHPAKQPDKQQQPERTTPFGGKEQVEGGKAGQHERSDKQNQ